MRDKNIDRHLTDRWNQKREKNPAYKGGKRTPFMERLKIPEYRAHVERDRQAEADRKLKREEERRQRKEERRQVEEFMRELREL